MRLTNCEVSVVAKISVINAGGITVHLTAFSQAIENFLGIRVATLSTDQVAEHLLDAQNITIVYDGQDVITQIKNNDNEMRRVHHKLYCVS